jgi:hypothetical protein
MNLKSAKAIKYVPKEFEYKRRPHDYRFETLKQIYEISLNILCFVQVITIISP